MSIVAFTMAGDSLRSFWSRRIQRLGRFELWTVGRAGLAYLVLLELSVTVVFGLSLLHAPLEGTELVRALALAALSIGYSEAAQRIERVRDYLHLGRAYHVGTDPTSVWTFAAALLLPLSYAAGVAVAIYAHVLFVGYRSRAVKPYRVVFGATAAVAGVLAVAGVRRLHPVLLSGGAGSALAVAGAVLAYTGVGLSVVVVGMRLLTGGAWRGLLPARSDVGFELATLVLGLLAAEILRELPWAAPAMLVVVAVLHRATLVDELRTAAAHDSKTGLLNSGAWQDAAQRALQRAERLDQPSAVLMLDLDRFKSVNDTYGHPTGDRVLRAVAVRLKQELRGYDAVGRFGGEEFVALLDDVNQPAALAVAERLRVAVATLQSEFGFAVTTSIGVATAPLDGGQVEDLIRAADAALYQAKANGRDRVCAAVGSTKQA